MSQGIHITDAPMVSTVHIAPRAWHIKTASQANDQQRCHAAAPKSPQLYLVPCALCQPIVVPYTWGRDVLLQHCASGPPSVHQSLVPSIRVLSMYSQRGTGAECKAMVRAHNQRRALGQRTIITKPNDPSTAPCSQLCTEVNCDLEFLNKVLGCVCDFARDNNVTLSPSQIPQGASPEQLSRVS